MYVEYTRSINSHLTEVKEALNERSDNFPSQRDTKEQKLLIERLINNPQSIYRLEDFTLLKEIAVLTSKMWKNKQTLKVYFFGGQNDRTKKIMSIASEWSKHCSINFSATNIREESNLRISFNDDRSCWSYIGTDAKTVSLDEATMHFGWLSTDERENRRVILHEFGHALGLIHEHQSPSIKINWNKEFVYSYCNMNYNWSKPQVDRNIFEEFEETKTKFSEVDKKSIMAYEIFPNFTLDGTNFPSNYDLSEMDKKYIKKIYP